MEGGAPVLVDEDAVRSSSLGTMGFSPNGRYFGYTTYGDRTDDVALHVVDGTGAEVLMVPYAAFGAFFPDGERILVVETDEDGRSDGLAWVDLDEGTPNRITHLAGSSGWIRPVVLADGERIAFHSDEELLVMEVTGGAAQRLYEFDSPASAFFLAPDNEQLVVYDQFEGERVGELRLIDFDDNSSTRVDTDLNLQPWSNRPGEQAIKFSPDGDRIAYLAGDSGNLSLYVTGVDGRNRHRISDDNAWSTFDFAPNGREIAFIEATSANSPGALYVADVDGGNRLRLDVDVWSFRFIDGGRRIIYSKVDDLDRGDAESEIYRIDVDGDKQELVRGFQSGLISFLTVLD
jgi:Tol biopolymer transport system component